MPVDENRRLKPDLHRLEYFFIDHLVHHESLGLQVVVWSEVLNIGVVIVQELLKTQQ